MQTKTKRFHIISHPSGWQQFKSLTIPCVDEDMKQGELLYIASEHKLVQPFRKTVGITQEN